MKIRAEIVCDSINWLQQRITTFVLEYPRIILAELNTHRQFSRNSSSARSIPVKKMLENVWRNPFVPSYWGKNQKGMQAHEEIPLDDQTKSESEWRVALTNSVVSVQNLMDLGVHKQIANRLLEPWMYTKTVLTGTAFGNFFNLRCHKDAQPEMQELAYAMLESYMHKTPKLLHAGQWHIPFVDKYLQENLTLSQKLKISVARCARVSYLNFDDKIDHEKDYQLHDTLLLNNPKHASPAEHQAVCIPEQQYANFYGWRSYRNTLKGENLEKFDGRQLLKERLENSTKTGAEYGKVA